ncbi:MAG: DNA repair protein RecN [Gammaproteobacteria bacterium]|nr:DNA repair protein RecN [Gammaproteobacteria bacterium]NNF61097.1 DNA repair protein RecN [Gammaproteobacteria bacterium]
MLSEIQVNNYAVIDSLELELDRGLTVLTGETGAGKSLLVGALGLVLGDRADAAVIRDGADKAEVSAAFAVDETVAQWLGEQELDADGECLVRRVVSRQGRSRAWINGHAVTLQTLRELATRLVDIHGQHMHQSLTRRPVQRGILDEAANNRRLLANVARAYADWRQAADDLEQLEQAQNDRESRLDLLRFHIDELDALGLADNEVEQLTEEQKRLAHAGRLVEGSSAALERLADDDDGASVQQLLGEASRALAPLAEIDPALSGIVTLIGEAEIHASEAASGLADYCAALNLDPARRDWVEQRLTTVQSLSRKHRVTAAALSERAQELREEYARLEDAESHLEGLRERLNEAAADYDRLAAELAASRRKAAKPLDKAITAAIQDLGMPGGRFETVIQTDTATRGAYGSDVVEFHVSANPGQDPRPLARVASGGELSRISLAIEVMAADSETKPTMVFDEVDSGVGGGTAEIVGQQLRQVGQTAQVLCVTHLPQVASQAHNHVRVTKLSDGKTTHTTLTPLGEKERVEELARMLGGVEITDTTLDHAREMIARAGKKPRRKKVARM